MGNSKRAICSQCGKAMYSSHTAKCLPTCLECRKKKHGTEYMYRKKKCRCAHCQSWYQEYRQSHPPCSEQGCNRPVLGRNLCPTHYNKWHRQQRKYEIVCQSCGNTAIMDRAGRKYCTYECATKAIAANKLGVSVSEWVELPHVREGRRISRSKEPQAKLRQCEWCLQLHQSKSKFCSDACSNEKEQEAARFIATRNQQMLFRRSFEDGDYATFFSELRDRVHVDHNGCWIWRRKLKNGYPVATWRNAQVQVHRLSLEAKHGKPLGTQAAHHICAVPDCVNPDHLQPVTHRDNVAEMMQRRAYLDRIQELTAALASIDPDHPALNRIEVA